MCRFFRTLHGLGFRVMHSEPNFYSPRYVRLFGHVIPVYAETVWVNVGVPWVEGHRLPPSQPMAVLAAQLDEAGA